ncbi:hypothetical protein [Acinetobacter marinus]|uniref:hypothetical protein n=1 Tax=Acinetobacter marinus TaxID=281375 RepID=UPI00115FE2BF|nr:hypothetical protein [Acinetobacter marinus]
MPQPLGIATFTGMLLGFVVWLGYIIFVFSCKTIAKLGIISLIILLVMAGLAYGLKYWSGV